MDLCVPQGSAIGVTKYRKTGVFDFLGNVRSARGSYRPIGLSFIVFFPIEIKGCFFILYNRGTEGLRYPVGHTNPLANQVIQNPSDYSFPIAFL